MLRFSKFIDHSGDIQQLRESELQYRQLVELSPDTIAVHQEGKFVYINPAGLKLLHANHEEELIGKSIFDIVHPDYRDLAQQRVHQSYFEHKINELAKEKFITLDGQVIDVEVITSPISFRGKPATQVIVRDITERLRLEEDLRQSHQRMQRILTKARIGTALVDVEGGRLLGTDSTLQQILGYSEEELLYKTFSELTYPEDTRKNLDLYEELLEGKREHYHMEKRYIRKDGSIIWGDLTVSLVNENPPSIMAMVKDITERKLAEQQLREAQELWQQISTLDGLTGIANRRYFDEKLESEWENSIRNSTSLSLLLIDIDYFKAYNDTYGHLGGDKCLRKVAKTLKETLKKPSDLACRYGGEEFVIILPDTDGEGARGIAENIRMAIEQLKIPHKQSKVSDHVTVCVGYATKKPNSFMRIKDFIYQSDQALYMAKEEGRNRIKGFA
ncbi:diguanylate cyclase [Schinkia azotoformans]|uniref:Cph2 n=1 Tax=Schinkia azotoformans LMG 9581 TaxID=1131731 RepID=K6E636_SCHAZ|nr:diguanylate cyclase [Schinkia azotoformans]EKN68741.1 Cph2 [Schinkia azotoformans LMG 9581]MEC1639066.1 diguanylate cyclase [Schinkia azotoformans]MEC1945176.1 diguanylate cyclase [Schinkia azotoformans]MED4354024.1 diguanylate cyclase [Schinkia azotoformans]